MGWVSGLCLRFPLLWVRVGTGQRARLGPTAEYSGPLSCLGDLACPRRPAPGPLALTSWSTPAPFYTPTQVHPDGLCSVLLLALWSCAEDLGQSLTVEGRPGCHPRGGTTWGFLVAAPAGHRKYHSCPWRPWLPMRSWARDWLLRHLSLPVCSWGHSCPGGSLPMCLLLPPRAQGRATP